MASDSVNHPPLYRQYITQEPLRRHTRNACGEELVLTVCVLERERERESLTVIDCESVEEREELKSFLNHTLPLCLSFYISRGHSGTRWTGGAKAE